MIASSTPGVHRATVPVRRLEATRTGVPAVLGVTGLQATTPLHIAGWQAFTAALPQVADDGYLWHAVRGFFQNGGTQCYVVGLADSTLASLERGLAVLSGFDGVDLVCAPDIALAARGGDHEDAVVRMRNIVVDHCDRLGDRFAILDSSYEQKPRKRGGVVGTNAAFYHPWVGVTSGPAATNGFVPPCGHVAGVYARSDARTGVHKVPANEALDAVVDVEVAIDDHVQAELNSRGVNCIRAFPGRGIRIWGGRTVSDEPAWQFVGVRRLFIELGRWIQHSMTDVVFEPNNARLWTRIERELDAYFSRLLQAGALRGATADEAYFIRCNEETNPPSAREAGTVVTEIGLAPSNPNEFVVVRITHGASGIEISGAQRSQTAAER